MPYKPFIRFNFTMKFYTAFYCFLTVKYLLSKVLINHELTIY